MTVIIPTRERADVFAGALRTVTSQDYENLEILVSDNFSGDATEEIARSTGDPRVKYLNTGKRLSMAHNWEFALGHATGEWVAIIGDDDGLMPGALTKVAALIHETGALAVQSAICRYRWPGNKSRSYGRIRVPLSHGHEIRDSKVWMTKVLEGRAAYAELPMLYTGGFVSMTVLEELKRRTGAFYKSRIPDVYTGFAVASLIPSYAYSRTPLAVAGISRHSIGVDQFSKSKKSKESPSQKFLQEDNIPFHKDMPLTESGDVPPSLQAVVFESYLQTICLRDGAPIEPFDHQLEIILASSPPDDDQLAAWAKTFARMHGLDYERIRARARITRFRLKLESIPINFARRIGRRNIGSPRQPIANVYDASLAAAAVLERARRG
ncbi:glycosyltransferase family 2 protein [Parvibaculum sp.]|uniref:glycosyltransferase family 2 protein n=1 Tax=Parvibaculum sp. TaxID=2024848 RepID=UPI0027366BD2|nr:glycosyltransferase family 2 protein [Parvibaculum sp.]MDP3327657.1 glycosyltransferase family 2 protein [Parvibaculum sp.]